MLTDAQITALKADNNYKEISKIGLKGLVSNLAGVELEFKPDISTATKLAKGLFRGFVIRAEIHRASCLLLERLVNFELQWQRISTSVEQICSGGDSGFFWMRYDEARVKAMFQHSKLIFTNSDLRNLIKNHSSIGNNEFKNNRLLELQKDLEDLEIITMRSIGTKDLWEGWVKYASNDYFRLNQDKIQEAFLDGQRGQGPFPILLSSNRGNIDE